MKKKNYILLVLSPLHWASVLNFAFFHRKETLLLIFGILPDRTKPHKHVKKPQTRMCGVWKRVTTTLDEGKFALVLVECITPTTLP